MPKVNSRPKTTAPQMVQSSREEKFYQPIKEALECQVVDWTSNSVGQNPVGRFSHGHLEITAKRKFSNDLKAQLAQDRTVLRRLVSQSLKA